MLNTNKPAEKIGEIFDESRSTTSLPSRAIPRSPEPTAPSDHDRSEESRCGRARAQPVFRRGQHRENKTCPERGGGGDGRAVAEGRFPAADESGPQFSETGLPSRVLLSVASAVAGKLDVLIASFDRVFTPVGTPLKQRLDVPVAAVAGSAAFQWTSVLKRPPGDYEVRAAVATEDGTRAASVIGYVDVPDVRKTGLVLSGVVVRSAGRPTLQRVFAAGESCRARVSARPRQRRTAERDGALRSHRCTRPDARQGGRSGGNERAQRYRELRPHRSPAWPGGPVCGSNRGERRPACLAARGSADGAVKALSWRGSGTRRTRRRNPWASLASPEPGPSYYYRLLSR